MWECPMPEPPKSLQIGILVQEPPYNIGYIKLWNFNKSEVESVKGLKKVEISLNGNIVWTGDIKKGCGNTYDNYCTLISLNSTI